jgi:pimeloyl-ACP methyl ester carboxylesterase
VTVAAASPTVVLVHGAFADASSWFGVASELLSAGLEVCAPPNPLRGPLPDAAYIASFATQIDGPVLLVGHSYGGVVITRAAAAAPNVVGLVYVAAFAPDDGETILDIIGRFPERALESALRPVMFPVVGYEPGTELAIDPALFPTVFGADLPSEVTAAMAIAQRPAALDVFAVPAGAPGWRSLPSWSVVATSDEVIHPAAQRSMAERAGAYTIEIDASHCVAVSQPAAVAELIRIAARSCTTDF